MDDALARAGSATPGRVVLLGASNLTRALPLVIGLARQRLGGPLDVHAALGHGRSYGRRSTVLIRSLPGVLESGLWPALEAPAQGASVALHALLTDVGNDIVYGHDPDTIAGWIDTCIGRLAGLGARIVMTRLRCRACAR